jgi:hypothetical protein
MSKRKQDSLFWGVVLLLIGVIILMDNLGLDIDVWDFLGTYWPVFLIAFGLKQIWNFYSAKRKEEEQEQL